MADVIDWLLEADNPPVRYLTLTELLGVARGAHQDGVRRARGRAEGAVKRVADFMVRRIAQTEVFVCEPGNRKVWLAELAEKPPKEKLGPGETAGSRVAERRARFLAEHGPGELEPKAG